MTDNQIVMHYYNCEKIFLFAEDLTQANMVDATNWEGEAGGQGIRALTR